MAALAKHYGLRLPEESYMLWVPRLALCLPLPPGWKEIQTENEGEVAYLCKRTRKSTRTHPCEVFMRKLIQFLRVKKALDPTCMPSALKRLTFCDELHRPYNCELRGSSLIRVQKSGIGNPPPQEECVLRTSAVDRLEEGQQQLETRPGMSPLR